MPFVDPITPVSGRYGAPLGRHVGTDFLCEGACPIYLRRVPLNSGGYDKGGAYWGHGLPLYCAQDQDGNTIIMRAKSRSAATAAGRCPLRAGAQPDGRAQPEDGGESRGRLLPGCCLAAACSGFRKPLTAVSMPGHVHLAPCLQSASSAALAPFRPRLGSANLHPASIPQADGGIQHKGSIQNLHTRHAKYHLT